MSSRFGRNKRRAARAQIAALEQQVKLLHVAVKTATNQRDEAEYDKGIVLESVRAALGAKFIGLPITTEEMLDRYSHEMEGKFRRYARVPFPGVEPVLQEMQILRVADVMDDYVGYQTHFRIRFGDGHFGYAISEKALLRGDRSYLAWRMSTELVQAILEKFPKAGG